MINQITPSKPYELSKIKPGTIVGGFWSLAGGIIASGMMKHNPSVEPAMYIGIIAGTASFLIVTVQLILVGLSKKRVAKSLATAANSSAN